MNERIKKIRKSLDMTQEAFASKIGLKQNSIALIESGKRNISSQAILAICREFNVREEWIRTGTGEMFKPAPTDILDELSYKYDLTNADYVMIEKFVNTRPEIRKEIFNFFNEVTAAFSDGSSEPHDKCWATNDKSTFNIDKVLQRSRLNAAIKAAHNDYETEPGELEKMRKDLSKLKKPD